MNRSGAIAALRQHARDRARTLGVKAAHRDLLQALTALVEDFRAEFDVPGVRYWETYFDAEAPKHHRGHFTTFVTAADPFAVPKDHTVVELSRVEFFSRQGAGDYNELL